MGFIKRGKGKIEKVFRFIKKVGSDEEFELKKTFDSKDKEEKESNGKRVIEESSS